MLTSVFFLERGGIGIEVLSVCPAVDLSSVPYRIILKCGILQKSWGGRNIDVGNVAPLMFNLFGSFNILHCSTLFVLKVLYYCH